MVTMQVGFLSKLILILVTVVILFAIFFALTITSNNQTRESLCKTTIAVKLAQKDIVPIDLFNLYCARKQIIISDEGSFERTIDYFSSVSNTVPYKYFKLKTISANTKEERLVPASPDAKNPGLWQQEITEMISYELTDCWNLFGKGDAIVLDAEGFTVATSCLVCSDIIFDKQFQGFSINLNDALKNNRPPVKDYQGSAWSYLYSGSIISRPDKCSQTFYDMSNLRIEPKESYEVIFYLKGRELIGDDCQAVGVVPSVQVPLYCDAVVN